MSNKVLLCILDGWGLGKDNPTNAISMAKKKNYDFLTSNYGYTNLKASGNDVGLPKGQFGNSEVGHTNIGAGRIILQDIMRISESFRNDEIKEKSVIKKIISDCNRIHIIGLLSDGGVHGHQNHFFELIEIFNQNKPEICLHCILDGRDSSPISGIENMKLLKKRIDKRKNIKVATVSGRFFAMDRDNRWQRVEKAYKAIIDGDAPQMKDCISSIRKSYNNHITDEFFVPTLFNRYSGVKDGDGFFITNYRADRVRELLSSIFDENFDDFSRKRRPRFFEPLSMVEYSKRLKKKIRPIFENVEIKNTLGSTLSKNNYKQLRIAETEKYAHVTYFFNGGVEDKLPGEDRILIPSPRVETYDLKPEMSAYEVKNEVLKNLKKNYDFIVCNFANPDMVGHTGNFEATVKAVEVVDDCIGEIYNQCKKNGYTLILTSDHGNADDMYDKIKKLECTTHSLNPVPFVVCKNVEYKKKIGRLSDIAPTILKLLEIKVPEEMNGTSIIK